MGKNLKLKVALFERNITQVDLASQTGVPRSYISLAIQGRFNLNPEQEKKIAKALGLSRPELFDHTGLR